MKAKEYAQHFNASPTAETLIEIGVAFDKETAALVKARGVKTNDAFLSVLREMDDKWQAFAKRTDGAVKPMGYRIIMQKLHPTTAAFAWPNASDQATASKK